MTQLVFHLPPGSEQGDVEFASWWMVTVPFSPSRAGNQAQLATLLDFRKHLLFIARFVTFPVGQNPDLQEVGRIGVRGIGLAMPDSRACHPLSITGANDGPIPHTVLVLDSTFQN